MNFTNKIYYLSAIRLLLTFGIFINNAQSQETKLINEEKTSYQVYFSPSKNSEKAIIDFITSAKKSVYLAGYVFTNNAISKALVRAHKKGIKVIVVLDYENNNNNKYSRAQFLANQGVNIRLNHNYENMHNKFIVVDDKSIELGSFNYSKAAVINNAENILILYNVQDLANKYANEFMKLFNEADKLSPKY